jgi:outer membrane protein OmpA-like peptidoglycan-associated protein
MEQPLLDADARTGGGVEDARGDATAGGCAGGGGSRVSLLPSRPPATFPVSAILTITHAMEPGMRTLSILPILVALASTIANAQTPCDELPAGQRPRIEAIVGIADYFESFPASMPARYRSFRGLLIEENLVTEIYPLLPSLFFDAGSATLPSRYWLFDSAAQTDRFVDTAISGGTLQKYYHLLNIVGARMRRHPSTSVEIVGCNSSEPALGETREISRRRAEFVRDYLRNVWGIEERRMKLLPARDLPENAAAPFAPAATEENRRVEIRSRGWEIVRPLTQSELRRYPQPEEVVFKVWSGVPSARVASGRIEISRDDMPWHTMPIAVDDSLQVKYDWTRNGDGMTIPNDETPYRARLVIVMADGSECASPTIEIPVLIIDNRRKLEERLVDKVIDRFTVLLFPFGSDSGDGLDRRIIREIVAPSVQTRSRVHIEGFAEAEPRMKQLSASRAAWALDELRGLLTSIAGVTFTVDARSNERPLYRTDLPEGRSYNRTVQFIIETPTGE